MYVGASLWVNSEMGTSLFHTCQYSRSTPVTVLL